MYIGNDLQIANPSYKIIDDISSGFDGSTVSFALQVNGESPVPFPISTQQVTISVNGVIQEPDPSGSAGFKLLGSNIVFSSAPANGHAFFGVINAGADYVTAGSEFPDGSATAPSFTFQSDQDTGWFRSGSGAVNFSANGVNKVLFDGNGLTVTGTTTATTFSGSGASLTHLNLGDSNNTGTVNTARLGSGSSITTKFLRGDNTWQTVTGTTINNNANNRIITGSGTANTLEGEANLTFDQSNNKLTIDGSSNQKIVLTGATNPYINFQENTTDKAHLYWSTSGHLLIQNREDNAAIKLKDDLQFSTDSSTFYSILHQGNVGSGGKLASTNVYVNQIHGSGANLTALNASNLGSGTVPTARLGSGTASSSNFLRGDGSWSWLSQSSVTQSTVIGANAGNNMTSGGLNNTLVGYQSAINLTSGDNNTTIGSEAGPYITTSENNTCIGRRAGWGITTGHTNIAIGIENLGDQSPASVTGSYNITLGYRTLTECTSGYTNTAIGYESTKNLTTGSKNIAIGRQTLLNVTTATLNTVIGDTAGDAITTGSENVLLGSIAGGAITTASGNTGIGSETLQHNITGIYNTALGGRAGNAVLGAYNTCLGQGAGKTQTTGNNNTIIGYDAVGSSTTVSNEATIGNTSVTKFRIPGINFVLKDNGGTPSSGQVLTADGSGEGYWAAAGGGVDTNNSTQSTSAGTDSGAVASSNYSTYFGYEAGKTAANNFNTLIGHQAGKNSAQGYMNAAIGAGSGMLHTSGVTSACQYNISIGYSTLSYATTANNNLALGYQTLNAITTGSFNFGWGKNTFRTLTTGSNNLALGDTAAYHLTTGNHNIAIGNNAGNALSTGGYNTFIGPLAGYRVTTANSVIAIGSNAMGYTSGSCTGEQNIAIGTDTLYQVTTGKRNTAIGHNVMRSATTAEYNHAIGYECLKDLTTGTENNAIGQYACWKVTTGLENHGLGYWALLNCTTGRNNVGLAGRAGQDITTGDNNICIGTYTGTSSSPSGQITTGDNNICLGNNSIQNLYCADTSISSSDSRDKADVTNFTHGLDWITQLRPVTYRWDRRSWYSDDKSVTPDGSKKRPKINIGFLAQEAIEIEKKFGYATEKDNFLVANQDEDIKNPSYGIKYERLVPILVNSIKELVEKNTALETRLTALEAA